MFSISNLNLQSKKNTKFVLSQFNKSPTFSILVLYESSSSSDTGHFTFIQQSSSDGNIIIKKLVWISESVVYSFAINPTSDWMVVSLRGGMICILPLGTLMGRVQRKCENWKTNDITYLSNKLMSDSPTSFMKWWMSSRNKNTCLIGKANGDFLIIDLANGSLFFNEKFSDHIKSIDLLFLNDNSLSYCIITTSELVQWKLLLEEVNNKESLDKEFGFEPLDFSAIHSCSILDSKSTKKSKAEHVTNLAFIPTKLYQFEESIYLKSQSYNGSYFIGAYDRTNGKYKLFDCGNLDSFLYEYQLPLNVVDICVTEELLFVIVGPSDEIKLSNSDIPSVFQKKKPFTLCILCRQYAQNHLFEKYKRQSSIYRSVGLGFFKPSIVDVPPNIFEKCVLFEFEIDLFSTNDILDIISLPMFFNFNNFLNINTPEKAVVMKNPNWLDFIKKLHKSSLSMSPSKNNMSSKWLLEEIKLFTPLFIIGRSGITVCYLSQCFEDTFIDSLLEYDIKGAEWFGAGLRLDMNYLYQYTAQLLASGNAQLGPSVAKSKKTIIVEYFDLGRISVFDKLTCLTEFWSAEDCLKFSLSSLSNIGSMSPIDRSTLSNSLISMFGYVMSDPVDCNDGSVNSKKQYYDKFNRFITTNCFFNDFKAAKVLIGFGLVEEAFFVAKEKGCVVEVFTFIMESKYDTNWAICFEDFALQEKYLQLDRDFVLKSVGLTDLEIVARAVPKLMKGLGEFICQSFSCQNNMWTNVFSYQTTTHLCKVFNPYGSIIDTLFHIYSCTTNIDSKRDHDLSVIFDKSITSSFESLSDTSNFSKTLKIRRELEPMLLAFCLLVISRDSQISGHSDYIYFIQLHGVINSVVDKKSSFEKILMDDVSDPLPEVLSKNDLFESKFSNKNFNPKKSLLSNFWQSFATFQCLCLRHDLCISLSIFEADLFEDENNENDKFQNHKKQLLKRKSSQYLLEPQRRQKCQINMLGFQKDKISRVLILPKSIENGKEIIRQVSLGKQHVLILTDCGSVYSSGSNVHGQLGIEKSFINESNLNRKSYRLSVINPEPVNMDLTEFEVVLSISTGDFHSGAIIVNTVDSEQRSQIITWGWGVHGQLGHNDIDDQRFPKRLNWSNNFLSQSTGAVNDEFPTELTMGSYHSLFITNKGKVYSFGNNSYGQLGIPKIQKSKYPMLVNGISQKVTHINTKYFHATCCTESNDVYSWGIDPNIWQNQFNQNKSHDDISSPIRLETGDLLLDDKIIQISCGSTHTTILTESKFVYSFGANMWGQLGVGNRKEYNHLVEVQVPKQLDFISTDNGITVGMNIAEKSTNIMVWGRCSHSLIQDNLPSIKSDTVKPQLLKEFLHSVTPNSNSFGIDALRNSGSTILNKHQLMIFFRNCSDYFERNKLINVLKSLEEYDIIADFFLVNDMLVESLFWRMRSLVERITKDGDKATFNVILEDIEIIFRFYIRISKEVKNPSKINPILTMITGFFTKHNLPWIIFERILTPLLSTFALIISKLTIKYSLGEKLTSYFIRTLLLNIKEESNVEHQLNPPLGSLVLTSNDLERFHDLIKIGSSETIYDAADDHKVVFFASCGHAAVLGRYREHQVRMMVDKLRRKQLNFSVPMIQRLYNDRTILPECLQCLLQRI